MKSVIVSLINNEVLRRVYFRLMRSQALDVYNDVLLFQGGKSNLKICEAINKLDDRIKDYRKFIAKPTISNHKLDIYVEYFEQWSLIGKTLVLLDNQEINRAKTVIDAGVQMKMKSKMAFSHLLTKILHHIIKWRHYVAENEVGLHDLMLHYHVRQNRELMVELDKSALTPKIKMALKSLLLMEKTYTAFNWHARTYFEQCVNEITSLTNGIFVNQANLDQKMSFLEKIYSKEFLNSLMERVPATYYVEPHIKAFLN